jgi:hypothetical protein
VILGIHGVGEYVTGLAKSLYTRGFELAADPTVEVDDRGHLAFSVVGFIPDPVAADASEISLAETWHVMPDQRWRRQEYAYDLIDRPRGRRRAFHLHDRAKVEAMRGTAVHEHCDEVLGRPTCSHYLGRDLPDGHVAIALLVAAWVKPGALGCASLDCLT